MVMKYLREVKDITMAIRHTWFEGKWRQSPHQVRGRAYRGCKFVSTFSKTLMLIIVLQASPNDGKIVL